MELRAENFLREIEVLKRESLKNPILVEGDHDISALIEIGIRGRIINLNQGLPLEMVSFNLARTFKSIIILTDFDRSGIKLRKKVQEALISYGCSTDIRFWLFIRNNFSIKSVEDIPWLLQNHSVD
ncbi:MAG: toprim domain-containing protein [Cuniculiplasma sp.]